MLSIQILQSLVLFPISTFILYELWLALKTHGLKHSPIAHCSFMNTTLCVGNDLCMVCLSCIFIHLAPMTFDPQPGDTVDRQLGQMYKTLCVLTEICRHILSVRLGHMYGWVCFMNLNHCGTGHKCMSLISTPTLNHRRTQKQTLNICL